MGYDLTATLTAFNLSAVDSKAPVTSLTGDVTAVGRGTDLPTLTSKVAADLSSSHLMHGADSIAVDTLSVRATAANGDAHVERLFASGAQTRATASGGFGLVSNRIDSLNYAVVVDSLGALNRWLPKSTDSTSVPPRPAVVARIVAEARADSARTAKRTEMERMIHGRPPPRLVVNRPRPVPRDTMVGRLYFAGTLRGNLDTFELRGRGEGDTIIARGNTVQHVTSTYAWKGGRKAPSTLSVSANAVQLSVRGFGFDTATARLTYATAGPEDEAVGGRGHVELAVVQVQHDSAGNHHYAAKGDYALFTDRRELRIAELSIRLDTARWATPHPDTVQWGKAGIRVGNFELRNGAGGRVRVDGLVPTTGVADLRVDVDSFPVGNVVELLQSDVGAKGTFALHGNVLGTSSQPTFAGRFNLTGAEYNNAPFPDLLGRVSYADERLVTHIDAQHGAGAPLMTVDARLPLNLAFTGVKGDRVLAEPVSIDVVGDSLPVDLIPDVTELVTDVHGRAAGRFAVRGTLKDPELSGLVTVDHGTMTIAYTGATIDNIAGRIRMAGDSVYLDSLAGSAAGAVRLTGALSFANWREPAFNLQLASDGARLVNNDNADLTVDTRLTLKGPFRHAAVGGDITIARGIIYVPESSQRTLVGAGDPGLFNVVDTTSELAHRLFPATSPLLANLAVNVAVSINQNTWVRNREANVEIYTSDPLAITRFESDAQRARCRHHGPWRVHPPHQAIPDSPRLGDVRGRTGPESDAADHRRVPGERRDARRGEHPGAHRRDARTAQRLARERRAAAQVAVRAADADRVRPIDVVAHRLEQLERRRRRARRPIWSAPARSSPPAASPASPSAWWPSRRNSRRDARSGRTCSRSRRGTCRSRSGRAGSMASSRRRSSKRASTSPRRRSSASRSRRATWVWRSSGARRTAGGSPRWSSRKSFCSSRTLNSQPIRPLTSVGLFVLRTWRF